MNPRFKIDNSAAVANYPWSEFRIQHSLLDQPLLALEQLVELAGRMPLAQIEYSLGTIGIGQKAKTAPLNGLTPAETIANIEQCQSWLVIKNPEIDPEYRDLLDSCLDELTSILPPTLNDLHNRESYIFVTSPNSITPFHIDPEHNFLLQMRGQKTMNVWPRLDREILPEPTIERTIYGPNVSRSIDYQDSYAERGNPITLTPGDGVYVPVHAPHWVQNGPDVSISYSITYRSAWSRRNTALYSLNAMLRGKGFSPRPVGRSRLVDKIKYGGVSGFTKLKSILK